MSSAAAVVAACSFQDTYACIHCSAEEKKWRRVDVDTVIKCFALQNLRSLRWISLEPLFFAASRVISAVRGLIWPICWSARRRCFSVGSWELHNKVDVIAATRLHPFMFASYLCGGLSAATAIINIVNQFFNSVARLCAPHNGERICQSSMINRLSKRRRRKITSISSYSTTKCERIGDNIFHHVPEKSNSISLSSRARQPLKNLPNVVLTQGGVITCKMNSAATWLAISPSTGRNSTHSFFFIWEVICIHSAAERMQRTAFGTFEYLKMPSFKVNVKRNWSGETRGFINLIDLDFYVFIHHSIL